MRLTLVLQALGLAASTAAQSDLVSVLNSQPDLSTLLDLITLADLAETLSSASNITILAPTNAAFEALAQLEVPEGDAVRNRDSVTVAALLQNHVFHGYYPASEIGEVPIFAQTLLQPEAQNDIQPFTAITGGQYNGLVRNGNAVNVLSGEFTVSNVTQADIRVGDGIIVHVIDKALSFGPPLTIFTARYGYTGFNAALVASNLSLFSGIEITSASESPATDVTVFIPINEALEAISSVLSDADQSTLQQVLEYHVIQDNVIFSPSISNTTVDSVQGAPLTFSVTDDGSVFVNNAKVILPNVILYEGVAHIIDSTLNPLVPFDRAQLRSDAPSSDRVQFPDATSYSSLPFTALTFASETTASVSIDPIFQTAPAVSVSATVTGTTTSKSAGATPTGPADYTGGATANRAANSMTAGVAIIAVMALASWF